MSETNGVRATSGAVIGVIGGGIAGAYTAYALAKGGASPLLIERAGIAAEASGRNPGGLNPLFGAGIPGPLSAFALESFRCGVAAWGELRDRSGIDFGARLVTRVHVMLEPGDRAALEPMAAVQQATPGFGAEWLDADELARSEPRTSPEALGGLRVEGNARVDSAAYTRAVVAAAVSLGARVVADDVVGLAHRGGGRVAGMALNAAGFVPCDGVVVASGVWAEAPARWLGLLLPIEPWKGELVEVELDGPLAHTFARGDASVYGVGTNRAWIGGTEARGFDQTPTADARAVLIAKARRLFPALGAARVVGQLAGVRPVSADGLPILGAAPGWDNVWLALGGGRKGMLYGAGIGEAVADLVLQGATRFTIGPCSPARFG